MRATWSVCLFFASLFWLSGTLSAVAVDVQDIKEVVFECTRAGFERGDLATYMQQWTDDAKIIDCRAEKPGKYDHTVNRKQVEAMQRLMFSGLPEGGFKLTFESPRIEVAGDAWRFVVPALEIIDSRIEGWKIKLCDTIADNASSARVVLGSSPRRVDERDLKMVGMILEKNGDIVQTGAGGAVLGHPAVAVAWLANAVGQFGVSLNAGDIVMPGALCGAVDVAAGDLLQASYDGLGTVSVRFV
jgi:hypothetical protein